MEIPYAFDIPAAIGDEKVTAADRTMAAVASGYWVQFGKSDDPNGEGRPKWPRVGPGTVQILQFTNSGVVAGPDPLKARLDLWELVWSATK